ncbi:hypothetical protein M4D76_27640 [Peribacillus frigoritolerans]|uniref:hypothetical protein n=1 Tax=Peribacillus frigoritolerans TaxID=450367 RepID=UPI0021A609D3|nr:hypothetical protein [Peribacillus frigoritolerans]MCT1392021.1 hypothetical protein [Peribacillus frigoritolerans]
MEIQLVTFEEAREFLYDFWLNDDEPDMTEEEHDEHLERIKSCEVMDMEELGSMLDGIGYWLLEKGDL